MKLNKILSVATAGAMLLGCSACGDDFLDEEMYSTYGSDVSDVNAKVLGLYYKVGSILGYSSNQGYAGIWQDGTDVGAPGDIQGVEVPFYQYANLNSENAGVEYLWGMLYSIINAANIIINDETADAAYRAEACFFRAWSYEQLVTGWGGVPLLTESVATPSTNFTRATIAEVNEVIESDLEFAIENLPAVTDYSTDNQSRINKDAARMWAAQAYLRIGYQNSDDTYYTRAVSAITPTITEAVFARNMSLYKEERTALEKVYADLPEVLKVADCCRKATFTSEEKTQILEDLHNTLYAAKICAYAQGFNLLKTASETYGWNLQMDKISKIWRNGCIIRARFLDDVSNSFSKQTGMKNLLFSDFFAEALKKARAGWGRVVALAAERGVSVVALSSALSYFDAYRTANGNANMLQAQRDYFGAHTYQRIDKEGNFHTEWTEW